LNDAGGGEAAAAGRQLALCGLDLFRIKINASVVSIDHFAASRMTSERRTNVGFTRGLIEQLQLLIFKH
jgi:hypothetical protein